MSNQRITSEMVRHVASLARLSLDHEEIEALQAQLDTILDYMASLDQLDVTDISPTFHSVAERTPLRPDETRPSLLRSEALKAAPSVKQGGFAVPLVLDGEG